MILIDKITQSNTGSGAATVLTFQHEITSQDAVLVVSASNATNAISISSVKVNGTPMQQVITANNGGNANIGLFFTTTPPTGSVQIDVVFSGSGVGAATAVSLLGVNKRTTNIITASNTGAGTTTTVNITPPQANSMILDIACAAASSTLTPVNMEQTQLFNQAPGGGAVTAGSFMFSGAGNQQTMSWTIGTNPTWAAIAMVLEPDDAPSAWYPVVQPRNIYDTVGVGGVNTGSVTAAATTQTRDHQSEFWKNSFLHTVGRVLFHPELNNTGRATNWNQSSQIIVDQVTRYPLDNVNTTATINHTISSPDAVLVVFVPCDSGVTSGYSANFNGTPMTLLGSITAATVTVNAFILFNPSVGQGNLTVVTPQTGFRVTAISLLGVDKSSINVLTTTNSGVSVTSIATTMQIDAPNSLLLSTQDGVTGGWNSIEERVDPNTSYKYVNSGLQTMTWSGAADNVVMLAIALKPARAISLWFPASDFRNSNDLLKSPAGIPNLAQSSGYKASQFFQNSFLHTIGRINGNVTLNNSNPSDKGGIAISPQIIIDNTSQVSGSVNGAPKTMDHRVSSPNAVVAIIVDSTSGTITDTSFNGQSLTPIVNGASATASTKIYYITNPPIGVYPITITGGSVQMNAIAITLLGVNTEKLIPNTFTSAIAGAIPSLPITPASTNAFIIDHICSTTSATIGTPTAGQSVLQYDSVGANSASAFTIVSSPTTLSWDTSNTSFYSAIELEPAHSPSIWFPNITFRYPFDINRVNAMDTQSNNFKNLGNYNYGSFPASFYQNSFLHTVGRIVNPTQAPAVVTPSGVQFITSQIIIDKITQAMQQSVSTISADHYVSSQDAVMVIFTGSSGAFSQTPSSVSLNGNPLSGLATNISFSGGGGYYVLNPPVGINTITATYPGSASLGLVVMTFLGVDKKATNPIFIQNTGSGTSVQTLVSPSAANSLLVDFAIPISVTAIPDSSQLQYLSQVAGAAGMFVGSIKLANQSEQNMTWTIGAQNWLHFILSLPPANAPSFWNPNINIRSVRDTISSNALDVENIPTSSMLLVSGNNASNFYQNSFLHTIGRMIHDTTTAVITPAKGTTLFLMGVG